MRLSILGSTRGTHLHTLVEAISVGKLKASIEIVISNKPDALILSVAKNYGLKTFSIKAENLSREDFDAKLATALSEYDFDLIVLIGYMRILSPTFVQHWRHKIINIHPSLLPAFEGKMDLAVHKAVLEAKVPETGCTVHYVTDEVDRGPAVLQKKCKILQDDTPETLKARVQELEGLALIEAIDLLSKNLA
ncbi:MAG: phosphoribosylglycinamide formyltransferase [Gammaproteobacteria bacterium]|nr:phosphoribosylglycinamide formyltransferase [Gammaproteobacteria bacterium]